MQPPPAPPLPPPSGAIVSVATVADLQNAVDALTSGTTILIQPGVYRLTRELRIRNGVTGVAIRGATNNRADVVILGNGMEVPGVNIALKVENAQDVLIANLSVGEAYWHPIQLQGEAGAERIHIYNVRVFDAGQQFIKSTNNPAAPNGVDNAIVEYSLIEYTSIGTSHGYTEGIDVHHGANWVIRYNLFRNIHVPPTAADRYRPAILMWSGSSGTIVHSNTFIDCERSIIFGLGPQAGYAHSHSGGAIYNNFIFRTEPVHADAGISIWDSPGTKVLNNTVIQNGTYANAIEYRFPGTTGVEIFNNLTDGAIAMRDGAQATLAGNYTTASLSLFVDGVNGDLHLAPTASAAIDRGVSVPLVTSDWDRHSRPIGAAWDIGADEYLPDNRPPVASATAFPPTGAAPLTVAFDGTASYDPENRPISHSWTFGDGQNATGPTTSHTYVSAGTYTVTLRVVDDAAQAATTSLTVTVTSPSPPPPIQLVAPSDLTARVVGATVTLSWRDNATTEEGYYVERAPAKTKVFTRVAELGAGATSFVHTNVADGQYVYRVQAFNRSANIVSEYSNTVRVRVR